MAKERERDSRSAALIQTFLPAGRCASLACKVPLPTHPTGTALFADISGFTPLSESLARSLDPQRGSEALTEIINQVFEAIISRVQAYGGDVLGFAGDAITCWFPESDRSPYQALSCALAMQAEMGRFAAVPTPDGELHILTIKVGLAHGAAQRLLVGAPEHGQFEVLVGATILRMAEAEHQAAKGEIISAPEIVATVGDLAEWGKGKEGFCRLVSLADSAVTPPTRSEPPPELTLDVLRPFFPPALFDWLGVARGQMLAELRPVVSAFVRFEGLDYEGDPQAGDKLDRYVRTLQRTADQQGGNLMRLDYGDKGNVAHVIFGAPVAHEDDEVRAIGWVLALQEAVRGLSFITGHYVGITRGQVYAGALGASTRRGYTLMGDEVNASARLMQACQSGQVLVSQRVMQAAEKQFMFHRFPGFVVKGKFEAIPVGTPVAPLPPGQQMIPSGPLVGRTAELAALRQALEAALSGSGQVIHLTGDAGVGKSRLAGELVQEATAQGVRVLVGSAQSVGQDTPYLPWRDIFGVLFGLQRGWPAAQQARQVQNLLHWINPEWVLRLPLFGDLLGIDIPDNPTTAAFDARLRQGSLFALVSDLLASMSDQQPLLILIEDCQWIDQASAALVEALAHELASMRVLLMVTQRRVTAKGRPVLSLSGAPRSLSLVVKELAPGQVRQLATARLGGELPPAILQMIEERSQGNPFFVEELAETLRQASQLEFADGRWILASGVEGLPQLPDTIQGVILARLDQLDRESQLTVKVASVVGRRFEVDALSAIHPDAPPAEVIEEQLSLLEAQDLVQQERPKPHAVLRFRQNATQEVAYATILYAQRRRLHRAAAAWYEATSPEGEAEARRHYAPLLAHHYRQAEEPEKERHYACLAGEQAARQYANDEAVAFLSRALSLTPGEALAERYGLLLTREKVYQVLGEREAQGADLKELAELAEFLDDTGRRAEVMLRQAYFHEVTGDYAAAIAAAQRAIDLAQGREDRVAEAAGQLQWGRTLWTQGEGAGARRQLDQALALARQVAQPDEALRRLEADALLNLGLVATFQGDYTEGQSYYEQALATYRQVGDRLGESKSLNGLGILSRRRGDGWEAAARYAEALNICHQIGERRGEAMLLTNLGVIAMTQGDNGLAQEQLEKARRLFRRIGDRGAEGRVLLNMGFAGLYQGKMAGAQDSAEASLIICRQLGDRRSEALALSLLGLLAHNRGDQQAAVEHSRGAAEIARELEVRPTEAEALTHLGYALGALGRGEEAAESLGAAIAMRRELGEHNLAIESLGGLVSLHSAAGDHELALEGTEEILAFLEGNRELEGTNEPLRVYHTVYHALIATGDPRAEALLQSAHQLLQERAAKLNSEGARETYLQEPAYHRQLVAAHRQLEPTEVPPGSTSEAPQAPTTAPLQPQEKPQPSKSIDIPQDIPTRQERLPLKHTITIPLDARDWKKKKKKWKKKVRVKGQDKRKKQRWVITVTVEIKED